MRDMLSRRELLKGTLATGAAGALGMMHSGLAAAAPAGPRRVLRVAHLTDMHVQPVDGADAGFGACLKHVQSHKDPVEAILFGGDFVMDAMQQGIEYTNVQWTLWKKVLKQECSLPAWSVVGNHDMWGWVKDKSKTTGNEPLWGKKRALDALGLDKAYYSFDRAGWHFIMLDSLLHEPENPKVYRAALDEAQHEWLERDLAKLDGKRPVVVVSHMPIMKSEQLSRELMAKQPGWVGSPRALHTDRERLMALFAKHPNVKLSLAGHQHMCDKVEHKGVTYMCNGAVCGAYWMGKNRDGSDAGYGLIDLYEDGSIKAEWVEYGWEPRWG